MAEGATTRAKAISQGEKDKENDNMADIPRKNNDIKVVLPAIKTPAKGKTDKAERKDNPSNNSKNEKEKEKQKAVKAKVVKGRNTKMGVNATQTGIDNYLQPKGFVADMVDQINSTPPNSPPHHSGNSQQKQKMLSIRHGQLSVEEDDMDECFQGHPKHSDTYHHAEQHVQHDQSFTNSDDDDENDQTDLADILKQLNTSVRKLEKSVRKLGADHKDADHKISTIEVVQSQDSARLRGIVDSLDDQQDKIEMLIGIVAKQDVQIQALQNRWDAVYAKEAKDNIVISGLAQTQGENCYHEVGNFMKNVLKVEKPIQLQQAFRIGRGQNRAVLAKLRNPEDRAEIYKKVANLKQANKGRSKPYFVSDQLPEAWAEKKRYVHFIKQQNKKLPIAQQANAAVEKGILSLDGKKYESPIRTLSPKEQCNIAPERRSMLRGLKFIEGDTQTIENSVFTGYAAEVFSPQQVQNFYDALRMRIPDATHISCAFLLPGTDLTSTRGSIDDGEHGAGRTLLSTLLKNNHINRAIFVTRHYGGRHIGATRFQIMEGVAMPALTQLNTDIAKRTTPLTDEQLRQLNDTIQQQAEQRRLEEQERKRNPWYTETDQPSQLETWGSEASNEPSPVS